MRFLNIRSGNVVTPASREAAEMMENSAAYKVLVAPAHQDSAAQDQSGKEEAAPAAAPDRRRKKAAGKAAK